jgi:hypothetical protein
MRERIHPRRRSDCRREPEHELGIDQRDVRPDERRAADVELDLPVVVGDHRPQRHFAARSRRRRDGDEGRYATRQWCSSVLVVEDRPSVLRDDADRLRGVHGRSAAEADEPVAAFLAIERGTAIDELDVGVRTDFVDSWIGDEHRPRDAELAQGLREVRERTRAVDQPSRYLHRADDVDVYGHVRSFLNWRVQR